MKVPSIEYQPDGGVKIVDVGVTDPKPDEVQVEALACGICAWDLYTYRNGSNAPSPAPPGHEGVGKVIKIGSKVEGILEGEIVVARGFAGIHNVPAERALKIPESNIPVERWIVEPVSCVVTGLDHTAMKAGDRIAVVGCGFMGLMLVQALANTLASHLIAVDINNDRLKLAEKFGADKVYHPEDSALKNENRFDTVIDASGSQAGLDLSTELVVRGGLLNLFGWNHGRPAFSGDRWHLGGISVVNSAPGSRIRNPFPPAISLLSKGIIDLNPLITDIVSLSEYPSLLKRVASGDPEYIKGVVKLS